MTNESRIPVNIEDEMKRSYLDYAMSVIIGRALPDVRDGLKPVHRRVLYAMREMGLAATAPTGSAPRSSATSSASTIRTATPPVYDTLVRMAQDFNMRYTLVDGQGNFGSVDGDPPAAYALHRSAARARWPKRCWTTSTRTPSTSYPTSTRRTAEPTVCPTAYPNLLVNGSTGIAVGMATNIPPHNMREVIDGVVWVIEQTLMAPPGSPTFTREQKLRELIRLIPGPDFPTGGLIVGRRGIHEAYVTGRGSIQVRAKAEIEQMKKGNRQQIVITEMPYQVNKAKLVERIADLVATRSSKASPTSATNPTATACGSSSS